MPIDGVTRAGIGRARDDLVEDRHQHVEPFDREARLAGERSLQETLENFDLRDAIEQRFAALGVERRQKPAGLGGMPQPIALFGHEDVRVVEPRRRAIHATKFLDRLVRRRRRLGDGAASERGWQALQILVGDPVCLGDNDGSPIGGDPERIELRSEVSVATDRI